MDTTVKRPGVTLLIAGIAALILRWALGWIPFIGGMLGLILLIFAVFAVAGGIWMIAKQTR
ncbi:MAG: hypothetical protein ACI8TP_002742 [Acidimicrobiales bacterium]|jgi:hypothetical protein